MHQEGEDARIRVSQRFSSPRNRRKRMIREHCGHEPADRRVPDDSSQSVRAPTSDGRTSDSFDFLGRS